MKVYEVTIQIKVDDDIAEKYPNYRFNYSTVLGFVKARIYDMLAVDGRNASKHSFGYTITKTGLRVL